MYVFEYEQSSVKSPASGKENVQFLDIPDFEKLSDFRTRHDFFGMSPKVLIIAKVVLALWQSAVQNQYRRTLEVFGFSFVSLCWKLQKQGYITSSGNKV